MFSLIRMFLMFLPHRGRGIMEWSGNTVSMKVQKVGCYENEH